MMMISVVEQIIMMVIMVIMMTKITNKHTNIITFWRKLLFLATFTLSGIFPLKCLIRWDTGIQYFGCQDNTFGNVWKKTFLGGVPYQQSSVRCFFIDRLTSILFPLWQPSLPPPSAPLVLRWRSQSAKELGITVQFRIRGCPVAELHALYALLLTQQEWQYTARQRCLCAMQSAPQCWVDASARWVVAFGSGAVCHNLACPDHTVSVQQ